MVFFSFICQVYYLRRCGIFKEIGIQVIHGSLQQLCIYEYLSGQRQKIRFYIHAPALQRIRIIFQHLPEQLVGINLLHLHALPLCGISQEVFKELVCHSFYSQGLIEAFVY